jgi:tripartite-type tricarboxylate transporter receptor subunit TctC
MIRIYILFFLIIIITVVPAAASEQGQANQSSLDNAAIRITVASQAGGSPDYIVRTLAAHHDKRFGTTTTVRNIDGLSGENGLQRFMRGDTSSKEWIILQETVLTDNPYLFQKSDEDPFRGLELIRTIAKSHFYLIVRASDSIQGFGDFLETTRAGADPFLYGTGGVGTLHHSAMEKISRSLALNLRHIPFRSNSQAVQGLVSGDVRAIMAGGSALSLVKNGDLRIIAVTAPDAMEAFPDIPPVSKFIPGFEAQNWFALFVKQGIPKHTLEMLQERVETVVNDPDFQKTIGLRYQWDFPLPALDLKELIKKERRQFQDMMAQRQQ